MRKILLAGIFVLTVASAFAQTRNHGQWLTRELLKPENANFSLGNLHLLPEFEGKLKDTKEINALYGDDSPEMADYKKQDTRRILK